MTWPTVAVVTTNMDAGGDSPASARSDLLDAVQKENQMIAHVSAFAATVLDDADAATMQSTLGLSGAGATGLRNKVINGDMRIDQRNSGAAITPAAAAWTVDRWQYVTSVASKITVQQVADAPPGFKNSLKMTVYAQYSPAGANQFQLHQRIEGLNLIDLQFGTATAKTVTVTFWIKASVAGDYAFSLATPYQNGAYIGVVAVTTSWVEKTIVIPGHTAGTWPTDTAAGAILCFDLGSGPNYNSTANAWQSADVSRTSGCVSFVNQVNGSTLNITGVDMKVALSATSFEHRPIGLELALCQRYYQQLDASSSGGAIIALGVQIGTSILDYAINLAVPMRAVPTVSHNTWQWSITPTTTNLVGAYDPTAAAYLTNTWSNITPSIASNTTKDVSKFMLRLTGSGGGGTFGGASGRLSQLVVGPTAVVATFTAEV